MGDQKPERRRSRAGEPLRERLSKRVAGYAAVAGAAGVGLAVAATPAKADVIYTPADITFKTGSSLSLDLNHEGTNDFLFVNRAGLGLGSTTFLIPRGLRAGNEILEGGTFKSALALPLGANIGPSGRFSRSGTMAFAYHASIGGAWGHAENRYLGLEFFLSGEEHFGWAEFSVGQEHHGRTLFGIQATLEGYAYDTVPNQGILAGQTSSAPEPGTLGLLAMGSLGLGFWRRKKARVEVQK
jgi:hypothetical protein